MLAMDQWEGKSKCRSAATEASASCMEGAINIATGEVALLVTTDGDADPHQAFLRQIRAHWRGWHIVLFEDRGPAHTAAESRALAGALGIEVRWLPRATPELNARDQLWKHVKANALASAHANHRSECRGSLSVYTASDPARTTSQGWHLVRPLLAGKDVQELLRNYLALLR
jgi:transposase